jgi:hypothetical protein
MLFKKLFVDLPDLLNLKNDNPMGNLFTANNFFQNFGSTKSSPSVAFTYIKSIF